MKAKRLLFLVMAICLTSGVKAQFYDGPDDIYYYLEESQNGQTISNKYVMVFNFDGKRAGLLMHESLNDVKNHLRQDPDYYLEKEESCNYGYEYIPSSSDVCYSGKSTVDIPGGITWYTTTTLRFSSDRSTLTLKTEIKAPAGKSSKTTILRRVDKSYFKVGRSRTPSGTMYE